VRAAMAAAADIDLSSAFELLKPSLAVFQRAVGCLAKLGRDAAVILRADELVLHGADDAHSAMMQFAFRRRCFRSTPAMRGTAPAVAEASVVVVARALLGALRGAQQRMAESLMVGLSSSGDQPRLVLQFTARFGALVRHRVPLLESTAVLPSEPDAGPHAAALSPGLLSRVLDHCSPPAKVKGAPACEEVTVVAVPMEGIRVRSYDLLSGGGASAHENTSRSEVLIHRSDLEVCQLHPSGGEVTLSGRGLRDFAKATDGYMRDLESMGLMDGSPLLELRFGSDGGSVVCRLTSAAQGIVREPQDFMAVLLIATRELPGQVEVPSTLPGVPETQTAPATQGVPASGRRGQPRQGSKRQKTLPPASAFDAFPDHTPSQPFMVSPSPAPPTAPRPAAVPSAIPAAPARTIQQAQFPPQPSAAHVPVQQSSFPPAVSSHGAASAAFSAQPVTATDSMPLLQGVPGGQSSQALTATQASQPPFSMQGAALQPPLSSPGIQEVPRPLVGGQYAAAPAAVPAASASDGKQWLWQGAQAFSAHLPQHHLPDPLAGGVQPTLASQLSAKALPVPDDSDDEEFPSDEWEGAYARFVRGDPAVAAEGSVDWFDVDRVW